MYNFMLLLALHHNAVLCCLNGALKLLVRLFHTSDLFTTSLFISLTVTKDSGRETPKQVYWII